MKAANPLGQDILARIRAANDIAEVIQSLNVPLKKVGASYKACCPFHQEKTPSFHVRPQFQSFKCFGCGKGGDVFTFVMLREGLPFMEAVRRLAERGRVPLPERVSWEAEGSRDRRKQLLDLHEKATGWFHTHLMRSPQAEAARKYLKQRAFKAATAKTFRLGYAPAGWDGLVRWAQEQKIDLQLLEEGGLVVKGNRGCYDRFRDRLMIPIADETGRVVAFSGRLLDAEAKEAKYINSPETAIFKKGRLLFGLNHGKRQLLEGKIAVVCEGQFDWIRCYEAGIHHVIASQGTAFTEEQARILVRHVEGVILCFDADAAGQKATWRNAEILIAAGLSVKAARMPPGEDPDSFIRKFGADPMKKILAEAVDVFEHKALLLADTLNMRDPINHRKVVLEMLPLLNRVDNEPQRQRIIQNVSEILGIEPAAFLSEFQKRNRRAPLNVSSTGPERTEISRRERREGPLLSAGDYLLRLVLTEERAVQMLAGHFEEAWVSHYNLHRVIFHVVRRSQEGRWKPGWDGLDLELNDAEKEQIARLLTQSLETDRRSLAFGLQDVVAVLRRDHLKEQCQEHSRMLRDPGLSMEEKMRLSEKEWQLKKELLDLEPVVKQT